MVSLTYPARQVGGYPAAPWIEPKAGVEYLREEGLPPGAVLLPVTHAHRGAPADRRHGRLPVVLYSPGNDSPRSVNTVVVEELASRGYAVVTIGHTFDGVVEFPGGRVVAPAPDGPTTGPVISKERVGDTRFVLDELAVLNRGGNPDAERRRLPAGLRGLFDLDRVGMFGHSAGGPTVASAMFEDRRIKAGLSLDGPVAGPVVNAGLDRPYMLMEATKAVRDKIPDLAAFWSNLKGWKLDVRASGAEHVSYTDLEVITAQAAPLLGWTAGQLAEQIGTLAPERAVAIQRAYPLAFFDSGLRHRGHLLDGPSRRFPEVTFLP
jgi:predicted dienelactone hydrolase